MVTKQDIHELDINDKLIMLETKAKLSTTWIVVLLNLLFRDIHELFRPGLLEQMITGVVNGIQVTDAALLAAGFALEIPILMVLLSRILIYRVNRWANIIVGILMIVSTITGGFAGPNYMLFGVINIAALLYIIWSSWTWSNRKA